MKVETPKRTVSWNAAGTRPLCQTRSDRVSIRKCFEHWTRRPQAEICFEKGLLYGLHCYNDAWHCMYPSFYGPLLQHLTACYGLFERNQMLISLANVHIPWWNLVHF